MLSLLCACSVALRQRSPLRCARLTRCRRTVSSLSLRAFLQNAHEAPDRLEPIRVLRGPLRVHSQTRDNHGAAVDAATLTMTEHTLIEMAPIWSGGTVGITAVARHRDSREGARMDHREMVVGSGHGQLRSIDGWRRRWFHRAQRVWRLQLRSDDGRLSAAGAP